MLATVVTKTVRDRWKGTVIGANGVSMVTLPTSKKVTDSKVVPSLVPVMRFWPTAGLSMIIASLPPWVVKV